MENELTQVDRLEQAILDLGSEVFRLRHTISSMTDSHTKMLQFFKGLQTLLDERGLINQSDFQECIDLGAIREFLEIQSEHEAEAGYSEGLKKSGH